MLLQRWSLRSEDLRSLALGVAWRAALLRNPLGVHWEVARTGWKFHRANVFLYAASELDKIIVLVVLTTTQAGLFAVAIAVSSIGTGIVLQTWG